MRRIRHYITVAGVLALALIATSATADVLHLKGGRRAEGRLVSNDGKTVVFEYNGQTLRLPAAQVEKVEQTGETGNPLAEADADLEAGRLRRAWKAYGSAVESGKLDKAQIAKAEAGIEDALDAAATERRKTMASMDSESDYLKSIEYARQQRLAGNPEAYENQVWRRIEGRLRVEAAGGMIAANQINDARSLLDAVEASGDSFTAYHAQAGLLAFVTSNWEDAAKQLGMAARRLPEDADVQGRYVLALCELGRSSDIVNMWDDCKAKFNRKQEFGLAVCDAAGFAYADEATKKANEGRVQEAKSLYGKCLSLRQLTPTALREAADFYGRLGDPQTAEKMRKRADAEEEAVRRRMAALAAARRDREASMANMRAAAQQNLAEKSRELEEARTIRIQRSTSRSSGG